MGVSRSGLSGSNRCDLLRRPDQKAPAMNATVARVVPTIPNNHSGAGRLDAIASELAVVVSSCFVAWFPLRKDWA